MKTERVFGWLVLAGLLATAGCTSNVGGVTTTEGSLPAPSSSSSGADGPPAPTPDTADGGAQEEGGSAEAAACTSVPSPGSVGDSCFAFDTCSECGVSGGILFFCDGENVHPAIPGCVAAAAMSGYTGACCPSSPCTRLKDDDSYCAGQSGAGGAAYACWANGTGQPVSKPTTSNCHPSGTTFDLFGNATEPSIPGAALSPAQMDALFCCDD